MSVDGIKHQSLRLRTGGGNLQQERMIHDKRAALDRAIWYSYQAAEVLRTDADYRKPVRALINPNKLKQDYDDKIISIGYEYNFKCGDVFEWIGTKTHWLIYLQDLTELAYFRGDIRRCDYEISWEDDGLKSTYAAVRGPVETKINYIQKHGISVDTPNYSLNILMPKTEDTMKYFTRYSKFYLRGAEGPDARICWRVEATDSISMPGILEINAVEYYANETEDDIENGLVGALIVKQEDPNDNATNDAIMGDTFIKPKKWYEYDFSGVLRDDWEYDKNLPLVTDVDDLDPTKIKVKWDATYHGQFTLNYGNYTKTIVVESLF